MSTLQIGLEWFPDGIGGGSSRFFSTLIDYLRSECVDVHGIVAGREPLERPRRDGIRIICSAHAPLMQRISAGRAAVREVLAASRVDLVASHFALFTAPCLDIIKHLPLVVHFHGPWAAESREEGSSNLTTAAQYLVEKLVYSRASKAIVLTSAFRNVLHRSYGVPIEKISVIPGAVDVARFNLSCSRSDARTRLGLPLDRPVIVAVRRLVKRMGLENLIDSVPAIKRQHRHILVVIVGSGHLADALRQRTNALDVTEHVRFTGRVAEEHLPLYYRAADLSIVPSFALEGFGLVAAESLACGTPALVTPTGGLPEAVSGLSSHLILEDRTPRAIAQGVVSALSGDLEVPSAAMCAAYARAHFSWPTVSRQVKAVYQAAL